jgi:acyl-CoA synthetase (AMP-forming)/AMP-acid ligase II
VFPRADPILNAVRAFRFSKATAAGAFLFQKPRIYSSLRKFGSVNLRTYSTAMSPSTSSDSLDSADPSTESQDQVLPALPIFRQLVKHAGDPDRIAVVDYSISPTGDAQFTYAQLLHDVTRFRDTLSCFLGTKDLEGGRVAFLAESGYNYVVTILAVWALGGFAVPLCTTHPVNEMLYTATDSDASVLLATPLFESKINELREALERCGHKPALYIVPSHTPAKITEIPTLEPSPIADPTRHALMIYTSGTTGKPKGVVLAHKTLEAQILSLVEFWRITATDRITHVLPLHHIHGIVNALLCLLWSGGVVEMFPKFDAKAVWTRWLNPKRSQVTVFMCVPTVYARLIAYFDEVLAGTQTEAVRNVCQKFRLQICGSAALPSPIKRKWEEISGGVVLLERYGMTEIGMALSNGYEPERRIDGSVGWALPGVTVRLITTDGTNRDVTNADNEPGEIQVKGDNVFLEYWRNLKATIKEFTPDGFFKTGDIAICSGTHSNAFFIHGRASVDIIKSGGYKISALDVERELLSLSVIQEAAVVGLDDDEWGQRVAAVVTLTPETRELKLKDMRNMLRKNIAPYKIPTVLKVVGEIPRNKMGKGIAISLAPLILVNKKQLVVDAFKSMDGVQR